MDKQMHSLRNRWFQGQGRPHKTQSVTVTEDLIAWNIDANNAHDGPV